MILRASVLVLVSSTETTTTNIGWLSHLRLLNHDLFLFKEMHECIEAFFEFAFRVLKLCALQHFDNLLGLIDNVSVHEGLPRNLIAVRSKLLLREVEPDGNIKVNWLGCSTRHHHHHRITVRMHDLLLNIRRTCDTSHHLIMRTPSHHIRTLWLLHHHHRLWRQIVRRPEDASMRRCSRHQTLWMMVVIRILVPNTTKSHCIWTSKMKLMLTCSNINWHRKASEWSRQEWTWNIGRHLHSRRRPSHHWCYATRLSTRN